MRGKTVVWLAAAVAAIGLFVGGSFGEVVEVGAGSYLIQGGGKGSPVRGPNLKGAVPTQSWFSNLVFKGAACNNQFPHPLGVRPTGNGLAIQYIGAYPKSSDSDFSGAMGKGDVDITLSSSDSGSFNTVALDGYSDWFIKVAFLNGDKGMHLTYGHGSPFVYATFDSGGAAISCGKNPEVWAKDGGVLGVTIGSANYGLFGPTGSAWQIEGNKLVNNGKYFSVAALPDNKPETLALFKKYAYAHVSDTKVDWKFADGKMNVTFNFTTKQYEGTETGTITALFPHQWKYTDEKLSPLTTLTYQDPRGVMKVVAGKSFTTSTPIQGILPELPAQGIEDKARMEGYLRDVPKGGGPGDTYGEGKTLGKIATFSGIAEVAGDLAVRDQAIAELKRRLEGWFTAAEGKGKGVFTYNPSWGILVGLPGSYGSDWPFNDHHFHYGYFIRAAAEVARVDPAWAEKWGPMVKILIREIASQDRDDKLFPLSRCFDRYEGHGWASGDAGFERGNNNESSSESMNAWYGITMWGAATGDTAMRDYGLYMFTTDMTSIEEYWFDVSDTNFPKNYPHEGVGMVWGDGGHWGTWFSGDPDCIHGIQYLPYTPGSVYLIRYPDYIQRAWPTILKARKAGQNLNDGWGDLMCMFHAGAEPGESVKFVDSTPNMKVEGGNSRAFFYQWVYTLNNLGTIDRTVVGDYPIYNVYNKGGVKSYAVYNYQEQPITVTFSDGKKVIAKPKVVTVEQGH